MKDPNDLITIDLDSTNLIDWDLAARLREKRKLTEQKREVTSLLQKLRVSKGNIYQHLSPEVTKWLIDEAIKSDCKELALIIASIVNDAYWDDIENESK